LSPGFCRNFGSGCEPECLHFIGVLSFDGEFPEDVACGGIQEKFRQAVAQGTGGERYFDYQQDLWIEL
jgi:hypothetical protein